MKILLVGEYSRLHNTLKRGLEALGHQATLAGSGDGFKQLPADYSYEAKYCDNRIINLFRQSIARIFNFDIATLERGIRFHMMLSKFNDYDVVQLINEQPVKTVKRYELLLLKRLKQQNDKLYLLSCGADYLNVDYLFQNKLKYSILTPYFQNTALRNQYQYIIDYQSAASRQIHDYLYQNVNGVIASDIDYVFALQQQPVFRGLIANPVDVTELKCETLPIFDKIVIFLGINQWNTTQKGISYFENALEIIKRKYVDKVEIIVSKNVPYNTYINSYNRAHILLDQVFACDQGYNALEAMAKGKVVFTGAEAEFMAHYGLTERVAVNALPDAEAIAAELEFLINNPEEIVAMGQRARTFVEKEHDYIKVAQQYLDVWTRY